MEIENKILNIKELANYLNCSVSMIRKLIYNNEIPYFKIGNIYEFHIDIINQWITNKHNEIEIGGFENEIRRDSTKI